MQVPVSVWVFSAIIVVILSCITFWITNKAYSKRWEDHDDRIDGQ
ncbi:hypothetical protein [Candidatus Pristimantibacillus sp. PTI5]